MPSWTVLASSRSDENIDGTYLQDRARCEVVVCGPKVLRLLPYVRGTSRQQSAPRWPVERLLHRLAVADVGLQLEADGHTALTEREIRTADAVDYSAWTYSPDSACGWKAPRPGRRSRCASVPHPALARPGPGARQRRARRHRGGAHPEDPECAAESTPLRRWTPPVCPGATPDPTREPSQSSSAGSSTTAQPTQSSTAMTTPLTPNPKFEALLQLKQARHPSLPPPAGGRTRKRNRQRRFPRPAQVRPHSQLLIPLPSMLNTRRVRSRLTERARRDAQEGSITRSCVLLPRMWGAAVR